MVHFENFLIRNYPGIVNGLGIFRLEIGSQLGSFEYGGCTNESNLVADGLTRCSTDKNQGLSRWRPAKNNATLIIFSYELTRKKIRA